ncbi:MAG: hypothetical protein CSH36_02995 [Thalassolituus sp.]|nr:MAG: hypothetical protein CSH36_02995 [Thalassolituus sp.]
MNPPVQHRLGQLLLNNEFITPSQLQAALRYQQEHHCRLGEALVALGAIDESILKRVLRRQKWLRPCAACFALMSPFSFTYAYDPEQTPNEEQYQAYSSQWDLYNDWQSHNGESPQATRLISTALDVYMGAPEKGEWRYAVSRLQTHDNDGYQVEVRLFF